MIINYHYHFCRKYHVDIFFSDLSYQIQKYGIFCLKKLKIWKRLKFSNKILSFRKPENYSHCLRKIYLANVRFSYVIFSCNMICDMFYMFILPSGYDTQNRAKKYLLFWEFHSAGSPAGFNYFFYPKTIFSIL